MTRVRSEAAFRQLYDRYRQPIFAYFLRRTDRESAGEGTVDVFLVAWRRFEEVPEGDGALPWLYGVSRRVRANQRRSLARRLRLRRRVLSLEPSMPEETEARVMRRFDDAEVLAAIQSLSESDQEVIRLAYWEELPHKAIGQILGCTTGAVGVRLHRAVRRLEKDLEPGGQKDSRRPVFLPGEEQQ